MGILSGGLTPESSQCFSKPAIVLGVLFFNVSVRLNFEEKENVSYPTIVMAFNLILALNLSGLLIVKIGDIC